MKKLSGLLVILALVSLLPAWADPKPSLRILCEDNPPNQFPGPNGLPAGYMVELVLAIQKKVGNTDPITLVTWANAYEAALKTPNVVLFSMARIPAREDLFQWVGPCFNGGSALFSLRRYNISLASLDEAKKLAGIGVYKDDVRDQYLTGQGFTNLERTNNAIANMKKLEAGHVKVVGSGILTALREALRAGIDRTQLVQVLPLITTQGYIAFSKTTDPTIVAAWQAALDTLKADGTLAQLLHKYLPDSAYPTN